jgi:transposase
MAEIAERLPESVAELRALVSVLRDELEAARREQENGIRRLAETETLLEREKAKYEDLKREIFGRKSEKIAESDPNQGELFNEAERDGGAIIDEERIQIVKRRVGKKGGRKRPAPELERIEKLHDLGECEKLCPCCGKERPRIGEDRSEEVEIVPARAIVTVHIRPKYGPCTCDDFEVSGANAIVQASSSPKILPGSMFSNRSIAFFLVGKYADGLPFHRQEKVIARLGLEVARGTMARIAIKVGAALAPIIELMHTDIRGSPVIRMDETPVHVLKEPGRKPESASRMWVAMGYREGRPILLFSYNQSRAGRVAEAILGDYQGCLQTDGYSGYTKLGEKTGITHVGCWAHIRREFHRVYESQEHSPLALEAIKLIRELFHIETRLRDQALVIGRKNWLFCDTPNGAWASATLYSLVETARANGHEPYRYLCHLFEKLPVARNLSAIEALLPYRLKPNEF